MRFLFLGAWGVLATALFGLLLLLLLELLLLAFFFYIVQCFIRENIHNTVKKVNNFSPALVVREDSRTSPKLF